MVMGICITAQSAFRSVSYGTKDGISSLRCRQMIKDTNGFMWITSDKGLNRYDGNSFYIFKHKQDDPFSLANNSCNGLLSDTKGRLWVNTEDGLSLYDKVHQNFTNFYPDTSVLHVPSLGYTQMAEDNDGRIWMGGIYDVLIFDPATQKFITGGWFDYAKNAGIIKFNKRNSIIQSIAKKSRHELWLLTVYGLFSVDTKTMKYSYYPSEDIDDYFAFNISHIDKKGVLWVGTYDRCFYTFDPNGNVWTHHKCPPKSRNFPDQMVVIQPFHGDTLVMMRMDEIYMYQADKKIFKKLHIRDDETNIPSANNINMAVFDDDIYILKTENPVLTRYFYSPLMIQKQNIPFSKDFINNAGFYIKNNHILTGDWAKGKMLICDSLTCTTLTYKNGQSKTGILQLYYRSLAGISYLSASHVVFILDEEKKSVEQLSIADCFDPDIEIEFRNFVEDNSGNVYVRERSKGIFKINRNNQSLEYFDVGIIDESYGSLYHDKATNKLWLATDKNGLYVIDPSTKNTKNYPLSTSFSMKKGFISDISGDGRGNVFLLMPGRGLMHIKSKSMQSWLYTEEDGLISDEVRYGFTSDEGIFWFTTESGIMAFDISKNKLYSFKNDPDAKLFFHRIFPDQYGYICQNLFPGQIIRLNKNIINKSMTAGKLYLKEVTLFDKKLKSDSIFTLKYDENNLALRFGLLSKTAVIQPEIEYNINSRAWQKMENDMSLNLFNLSPGKYILEIRQKNHPEIRHTIKVIIRPPWWSTWWFYTCILTTTTLTGFWMYKKRIAAVRKEEKEKNELRQQISKIEMSALRAQMNPHFIFNCLNSINRFILVNDTDAASEYLTKFSRLIRMILDSSREDMISLQKELDSLRLYIGMEAMRFQDSFEWKIDIDPSVQTENVLIPPLLLQPYAENAIWHGLMQAPPDWGIKKLHIKISSENDGQNTIISINDNGIGREKAALLRSKDADGRKSYGVMLAQERLKLLSVSSGNKSEVFIIDLASPDGKAEGTSVIIRLTSLIKKSEV